MDKNINIQPRMLDNELAAFYLGAEKLYFEKIQSSLKKKGFPEKHPILKKYDKHAIDKWIDETGGLQSILEADEQELLNKAAKLKDEKATN